MPTFSIHRRVTYSDWVDVKAGSEEEALEKAEQRAIVDARKALLQAKNKQGPAQVEVYSLYRLPED